MKARDIIKGWPRGRSTSSAAKWLWVWPYRLDQDDISNFNYHKSQQAMVTEFIEQPLRDALGGLKREPTLDDLVRREILVKTYREMKEFERDVWKMIRGIDITHWLKSQKL